MKSTQNDSISRKALERVRHDCKRWRRLVSRCAKSDELVSPAADEQYQVVHDRIVTSCRELADVQSLAEYRRRAALQIAELLTPWSSTKALTDAPPPLLQDLVQKETSLEERLRGKCHIRMRRLRQLMLVACAASIAGIAVVLFMDWTRSNAARPLFESLSGMVAASLYSIQQMTFTEQFAAAVLFSWLVGMWLLSRLSTS